MHGSRPGNGATSLLRTSLRRKRSPPTDVGTLVASHSASLGPEAGSAAIASPTSIASERKNPACMKEPMLWGIPPTTGGKPDPHVDVGRLEVVARHLSAGPGPNCGQAIR